MAARGKLPIGWYILSDYLAAAGAWIILYFTRRYLLSEPIVVAHQLFFNSRFWLGLAMIPPGWLILYGLTGAYHALYKKSRLNELTLTAICTLIGCTSLFFMIVINDPQTDYRYYYKAYFSFLAAQFILTWLGRWLILRITKHQLASNKVKFNTLLFGSRTRAVNTYNETVKGLHSIGYSFSGYIGEDMAASAVTLPIPYLGPEKSLERVIEDHQIDLVVVAIEQPSPERVEKLIQRLSEKNVEIKITPNMLDILSGSVKTSSVFGAVLMDIQTGLIPEWQQHIKRLIDILISLLGLILLSPLLLYAAIRVKFSSPGPVFMPRKELGTREQNL